MTAPQGWDYAELEHLTTKIGSGATPKGGRDSYGNTGTPLIRSLNVHFGGFRVDGIAFLDAAQARALENVEVQADDVLLNITGASIGRVSLAPAEMAGARVNQHVCIIRTNEGVLPAYVERFLASPDTQSFISSENYGLTRQALTKGMIEKIRVPVPPLAEQHRIVAKLDALASCLSHARAELNQAPRLGSRLQLAVLRSGVSGDLTVDWRSTAMDVMSVEYLLRNIPAPQQGRGGREATDKLIPGVAGLAINDPGTTLPNRWKWVPLLRVARQETGHTPSRSKPSYWDGGVPWIGIRDAGANHGRYIEQTAQTISDAGLANSSARLLPAGTVCLSRTASVGYVTIMARSMATSQDFATWTCTEALLPEYLMYALMAEGEDIRRFGMGSTHTTIYFPEIRALHIALPPVEEQKEIVARIKDAFVRADRLAAEASRARALLDRLESAILAKTFRGELVPQNPNDEPASILLERIRARHKVASKPKGRVRVAI